MSARSRRAAADAESEDAGTTAEMRTRLATLARKPGGTPLRFPRATSAPLAVLASDVDTSPGADGASTSEPLDELDVEEGPVAEAQRLAPEVEAAFLRQLTPALEAEAYRLARARAKWVHEVSRRTDPLYAKELVQDALEDTWRGVLAWHPAKCDLVEHICVVIKRRSAHDRSRLLQFEHRPLHDGPGPMAPGEPAITRHDGINLKRKNVSAEVEAAQAHAQHASQGDLSRFVMSATARAVVNALKERLADSRDATAMLDEWVAGCFERREVTARTGMSEQAYRVARDRVLSEATKLCPELREAALHVLRRDS